MSLVYSCGACGQKWTESELETEGAVGQLAWECPGCLSIQSLDNCEESEGQDDDALSVGDDALGESIYVCDDCGDAWTEQELVDEEKLTDWMWVCPGCESFHKS